MGIEGDGGDRRADETRIRRLQQILGSKRVSSPSRSGCLEGNVDDPIKKLSITTQNALNELKLEFSKMRSDFEKLTEEVHSTKKLEAESRGRTQEMERRFTARMEEFERCLSSIGAEALLLKDLPGTQTPTVSSNIRNSKTSTRTNIASSGSQNFNPLLSDAHNAEALRKDILFHTNPQHIQRTVTAVRGWLRESPTPRESGIRDTDPQRHEDHITRVPTSSLVTSIKNEAKLFSKHHKKANNKTGQPQRQMPRSQAESISDSSHSVDETTRPAMRILQKKNMRMADFFSSESDED